MVDRIGSWKVVVGRPESKRPRGRPGLTWEAEIKIYLQDIVWGRGLD
jgi:hypothetical protein